jgi:hypothetical protein
MHYFLQRTCREGFRISQRCDECGLSVVRKKPDVSEEHIWPAYFGFVKQTLGGDTFLRNVVHFCQTTRYCKSEYSFSSFK